MARALAIGPFRLFNILDSVAELVASVAEFESALDASHVLAPAATLDGVMAVGTFGPPRLLGEFLHDAVVLLGILLSVHGINASRYRVVDQPAYHAMHS